MACEYTPFTPPASVWASFIVSHFIIVFGILGNALALWCVVTCTKTQRPMKVLLSSVFLSTLAVCLAMVPMIADAHRSLNTCLPLVVTDMRVHDIPRFVIVIMVQIEVISIAAIAVIRGAAIWAPQNPTLGVGGAVVLVWVTCTYAILSTVVTAALVGLEQVSYGNNNTTATVLNFVNVALPSLITAAAYILMILVIQGNKRHLVASQQEKATTTMDQVTRAMLAVFISNLVFILPHSIYGLTGGHPYAIKAIFEAILLMHFVVDPLVYIYCNSDNREKVVSSMRKVKHIMFSSCTTQAIHQKGSTASCDQQEQQTSSTHKKNYIPL